LACGRVRVVSLHKVHSVSGVDDAGVPPVARVGDATTAT
jgi:hypothetical protein